MAKQSKAAAAPRLRFREYRTRPGWENTILRDVSTPVTERVGDTRLTPVSISAGVGFVPQAEKFGRDISGNQYKVYTLVRDGDFVYNKGNSLKFPQGCVYQLRGWGEVAAPNVFIAFRLNQGQIAEYFQYCFEKNIHGIQLKTHITSGARSNGLLNVSKDQFFDISIPTPLQDEQKKIADCLTSLDEVIAAQARKVEALKAHKRGLMQQLFPREGETRPRVRFPEFCDAPRWELKRLDQVSRSIFDGTHQTPTYTDSGIPFFSVENLISGNANKFISPEDYSLATRKNKPEKGDVLFTRIGKIGYSQVVTWEYEFSVYVTLAVIKMAPDVDSRFLHYAIQSELFQSEVRSKSLHNAVPPKINMDSLRSVQLLIAGPAEQKRIADCLSSLDTKIAAESEQLATLKTHKQGLMQQLFPVAEGN